MPDTNYAIRIIDELRYLDGHVYAVFCDHANRTIYVHRSAPIEQVIDGLIAEIQQVHDLTGRIPVRVVLPPPSAEVKRRRSWVNVRADSLRDDVVCRRR